MLYPRDVKINRNNKKTKDIKKKKSIAFNKDNLKEKIIAKLNI